MRNTRYVDPFTFQRAKYWSWFSREIEINSESPIPNLSTCVFLTPKDACYETNRTNWVAELTRQFTTSFHRLPIDPTNERRQPAPISHSLIHELQFPLRFRQSRVIMHQTTNRSNLPHTVALRLT